MLDKVVLFPKYPCFKVYTGKKYYEISNIDTYVRSDVGALMLETKDMLEDIVLSFNNDKDIDEIITKLMHIKTEMAYKKETER